MRAWHSWQRPAAGAFGGWSDLNLMRSTYTHAEDTEIKVNQALNRGLLEAERKTGTNVLILAVR